MNARIACALALAACITRPASSAAEDVHFHGLLDVAAARGGGFESNVLMRGDSPFDGYGLRVFADTRMNARVQVFAQMVLRDATTPYVDGAYAMLTPDAATDVHLLAGKVPWPIGTWAPRTYSDRNPLMGVPLMYQYHSTLLWYDVPPDADALIATAGTAQSGQVDYYGYAEGRGMAIVDDSYWDVGATLVGSVRPVEFALGVTSGTPGWGSTAQDENGGKCVLGRLGLAPLPGVRFGVSGAYGPYLDRTVADELPPGDRVEEYHQKLMMADAEWLGGHAELRAEGAHNVWETPTVGDLPVRSGYVELKYTLPFSTFAAGRWDVLRFGDIADSTGAKHRWDADVTRIETGLGYRFTREVTTKVVYQHTRFAGAADGRTARRLVGAQLSVAF